MREHMMSIGWRMASIATGVVGVWLGLTFILANPQDYTRLPAFVAAIDLMPLRAHGFVYLSFGILVLFGYITGRFLVTAFILTAANFTFWATLFFVSWTRNHHSPLSGVPLYLFAGVVAASLAMTASAERYG